MNLSAELRILLARICQEQGLLLFEDNPYGLLGFDGATMWAIQPEAPAGTYPRVTKRVGASPPQYDDWDEEEDEDSCR